MVRKARIAEHSVERGSDYRGIDYTRTCLEMVAARENHRLQTEQLFGADDEGRIIPRKSISLLWNYGSGRTIDTYGNRPLLCEALRMRASNITVQGARYPERLEKLKGL
jgi:hypothetical protein